MARQINQCKTVLNYANATTAAIEAGTPVAQSDAFFAVALTQIPAGDNGVIGIDGIWELDAKVSKAVTAYAPAYWKISDKVVADSGDILIGRFVTSVATTDATAQVLLVPTITVSST